MISNVLGWLLTIVILTILIMLYFQALTIHPSIIDRLENFFN